jgi:DNA-directed RNA polymerase specialized sigma24 family protein
MLGAARPRFLRTEDDLGYLLRVLRNTFLNLKRTERRRPRAVPLPEGADFIEERNSTRPERALEATGTRQRPGARLPETAPPPSRGRRRR